MAKKNSETGQGESENFSQMEREEEEEKEEKVTDYEKKRLHRIAENKARMEALGLAKISSSLMGSPHNSSNHKSSSTIRGKSKRNVAADDDEDYKADDDIHDVDDDEEEGDDDDDYYEFVGSRKSTSKSRKSKDKVSKHSKKGSATKQFTSELNIDGEDDELVRAIALSLQESPCDPTPRKGKVNSGIEQNTTKRKRKNPFSSRWKMTEDEVILHFFQMDEAGQGMITRRDLQKVAIAHDFTWTDEEITGMIKYFDSDGDGKLNLDDFRKIVGRCNMLQGSEND